MIIHCDDRGFCLTVTDGLYSAGCHNKLTREQALGHWGSPDYPDTDRGAGFVAAIQRGAELSRLPEGLVFLFLCGGTLPDGIVLPEGLKHLYLDGSTLPAGTVLPAGLIDLSLGGGTLPDGTALPTGLLRLYLDGGTLPKGTVLPDDLRVVR